MTVEEINAAGRELNELLILRYSPIAFRLIYSEDEISEGTLRPCRDKGGHLAMCQAFAMVRRERRSVAMLKDDHWCVWPLVSYGLVDLDEDDIQTMGSLLFFEDKAKGVEFLRNDYPRLKAQRRPIGFELAPMEKAKFVPDIISLYCRPAQLRSLLMAVRYKTGEQLELSLDSVDSCVHSTIPVLNGKDFNVTFPDPGEYERALTDEDELIFTMRSEHAPMIVEMLKGFSAVGMGYRELAMKLEPDHARPRFYNDMFERGIISPGLATGYTVADSFAHFTVEGEADDPKLFYDEFLKYISETLKNGLCQEDFERTKRVMFAEQVKGFDSTEGIGDAIFSCAYDGIGIFDYFNALNDVSFEDVSNALTSFFGQPSITLSVVLPLE